MIDGEQGGGYVLIKASEALRPFRGYIDSLQIMAAWTTLIYYSFLTLLILV